MQQENLYSPWTIDPTEKRYLLFLVAFLFLHLVLALTMPPAEDELYYLAWSQLPSFSYFDHPPMVAWWIRLSTLFFGNSILAMRLPAILTHFALFYQLGTLSRDKTILWFLLLTPLSVFGAVIMTPDIPFLFFWLCYFKWTLECDEQLAQWSNDPVSRVYRPKPLSWKVWTKGGALLGLGLLSKYTMALAPLCALLIFSTQYRFRSWAQGFLLHSITAGIFFIPVLAFNFRYHFEPFQFQWNHMQIPVPFSFFYTFLGNQILILGALPFLLFPWVIFQYRRLSRSSRFRVAFVFFVAPISFFLFKATHHFLEANWALASYLSFWILGTYFFQAHSSERLKWGILTTSFLVPLILSVVLFIHLFRPLSVVKISQDRLGRMKSQLELTQTVKNSIKDRPSLPFYLPNYQWTSYFRYGVTSESYQLRETGRPSHFTLENQDPCQFSAVRVFQSAGSAPPDALKCFKKTETIGEYPLSLRGAQLESFILLELSGRS